MKEKSYSEVDSYYGTALNIIFKYLKQSNSKKYQLSAIQ